MTDCTCTHHTDNHYFDEDGMGRCERTDCPCQQYTAKEQQ